MKNPKTDPIDYDGMGDFSRYRTVSEDHVSLENSLKRWFKEILGVREEQKK